MNTRWDAQLHKIADAALEGFLRAVILEPGRRYVYFRESTDTEWGRVALAQSYILPGWELATPEPVPMHRPIPAIKTWLLDLMQRLPLLPTEEVTR